MPGKRKQGNAKAQGHAFDETEAAGGQPCASIEERKGAETEGKITRRTLIASLGTAGAAIAFAGPAAWGKAASGPPVTSAVYGGPDSGVSLSCKVETIDSVHALLDQTADEQTMYWVKAYYVGERVGGGEFFYKPDEPKANHNGGDIISSTVPWDGSAAALADFLSGTGETNPGGNGCFVRKSCVLNPYMFGCLDGVDLTAGLQAFAARASTVKGEINWDIDTIVSSKIVFRGGSAEWPSTVCGTLKLQSNYASDDWMLEIDRFPYTQFDSFVLKGKGNPVLTSRTNHRGAKITDVSGSVFRRMDVRYMKVQGIEINFNAYHVQIESVAAFYCGFGITPTIGKVFQYAGHSLSGSSGGPAQFTQFTGVTDIPDEAQVGSSLVIGRNEYTITDIDRNSGTVTVRLWVTNDDFAFAKEPYWCIGSGFKVAGGTTGPLSVTSMTTLGCSIGYFISQLYPGFVGKLSGESNLVTAKLGSSPYNGHLGGFLDTVYAEAGRIAVSNNNVIGRYVIGNLDPVTCDQRISQGVGRYLIDFDFSKGAVEAIDLDFQDPSAATAYRRLEVPVVDPAIYGPDVPATVVTGTSATLAFSRDDFISSGISHRLLVFPRTGTRTVTINAGAGTTIGSPAASSQSFMLSGPSLLFAEFYRASKNWRISRFDASSALVAATLYNAPSLASGERDPAPPSLPVSGAALGDFVEASLSVNPQGIELFPYVSAPGTVTVEVVNRMPTTIDLPNATLTVRVHKR
ncbi:hypothetical protein DLM86_24250 [Paenibacillus flagellatus]|uniref:Uncharacterized protein n=2 Tax=Paenibacillus flagellatus TaxID=2211139 RepID=A0A2V5KRM5_9BACL|nr:hypothetical protein DLM86_24250 [Paenibacillus flagellatus]